MTADQTGTIVQRRDNSRSTDWQTTTDMPSADVARANREYGWRKYRIVDAPSVVVPDADQTNEITKHADAIMAMIRRDMRAGLVPFDVGSFSALHNHRDANMYVLIALDEVNTYIAEDETDDHYRLVNAVMDAVDARLRAEAEQIHIDARQHHTDGPCPECGRRQWLDENAQETCQACGYVYDGPDAMDVSPVCAHAGRMCSPIVGDCLCRCAECAARRNKCGGCGVYTSNGNAHVCVTYNGPPCATCGEPTTYYDVSAPGYGSGRVCKNGHDEPLTPHGILTIDDVR